MNIPCAFAGVFHDGMNNTFASCDDFTRVLEWKCLASFERLRVEVHLNELYDLNFSRFFTQNYWPLVYWLALIIWFFMRFAHNSTPRRTQCHLASIFCFDQECYDPHTLFFVDEPKHPVKFRPWYCSPVVPIYLHVFLCSLEKCFMWSKIEIRRSTTYDKQKIIAYSEITCISFLQQNYSSTGQR